jgi:hypothetical protein
VYSFGKNVENAENNAAQLNYNAVLEGNTLRLDESVDISGGLFRGQTVELVLYIPENKFLKTDSYAVENMLSFLEEGDNACELDREGTEIYRMEKNGQMECMSNRYRGGKSKLLNNYNFKTLKISDLDDIEVKKGTTFSVKLEGREESISETEVVQNGQTLVIRGNSKEGDSRHKSKYGKVRLVVMMPELELLDVEGRGKLEIRGFNQPEMAINLFGNQAADLLIDVENLKLDIEQAEVHLQGKGRKMDARVLYGVLKARQYTLKDVDITLKNGAEAQIYATGMVTQKGDFDRLEISGGAEIRSKKEL